MFRTLAVLAALATLPVLAGDDRRDDGRRYGRDDRRVERDSRRDNRDRRYGNNDRNRGRLNQQRNRATPVDRAISDLRRAQSRNRYDNEKREHFERAFYHLDRFNYDWGRGKFTKDRLDDAIERIDKLAHSDQIRSEDRDILRRDLADLRAFRSSRGSGYGTVR